MSEALVFCGDPGVPLYGPSGASAHLRGVARALHTRGWTVTTATPRLVDARGPVDEHVPGTHLACPPPPRRRWRELGERLDARRLGTLVTGTPALVWERYALGCEEGLRRVAGWRRAGRDVVHLLEVNAPLSEERACYGRLGWPRLARWTERRLLRGVDRVIVVSAALAAWAESFGAEPARIRVVHNGTSLPTVDRDAARRRLGVEGLVLVHAGGLRPWHDAAMLPSLLDALPEATLLVAGEGPCPPGSHPRLRRLGRLEATGLAEAIAAADVALAPGGAPWQCPLKLLDYRSQGVPIVATDVGEAGVLVGEGRLLAPEAPSEAWVEAVRDLAGTRPAPWRRTWEAVVDEALDGLRAPTLPRC